MKKRCFWVNDNPLMITYHDQEWGRVNHDDQKHFEMLTLEGAQAGLSWETILNKRENYRKLFADFDPNKVAKFTSKKIEKLLNDKRIIRNKLKVNSCVTNAQAFLKIQKEYGTFDKFIWSYFDNKPEFIKCKMKSNYPTQTELSKRISKDLKKLGFKFVGPTIIYAYMEACGMVQNHSFGCYLEGKKI